MNSEQRQELWKQAEQRTKDIDAIVGMKHNYYERLATRMACDFDRTYIVIEIDSAIYGRRIVAQAEAYQDEPEFTEFDGRVLSICTPDGGIDRICNSSNESEKI
tara:strand:+ start:479 stop:790 length:312 start_codon:yes stop_codon:yes gene_type:complete